MNLMAIDQRLNRLEQRVENLERHMGLPEPMPDTHNLAPASHVEGRPRAVEQIVGTLDEPLVERLAEPPLAAPASSRGAVGTKPPTPPQASRETPARRPIPRDFDQPPVAGPQASPAPVPAPSVLSYSAPPKSKAPSQNPLEQVIGIKWAGWIGAVVLVVGAALGIKYAYDQGLFPTISPTMRLVMMSLGGFGLIGAGEWVYRRVGKIPATGFFGAGVAMLFVISYAGYGFYDLYTRDTAFLMMSLCTLIGASVAMRAQLVSVAVLSLIGGNLAPMLLHGNVSSLLPFLLYLLMLQAVALILAYWGASEKWWTLRGLSLATTSLWVASIIGRSNSELAWTSTMWFTLLYGILFHVELLLSAGRTTRGRTLHNAGVIFSMVTTAALSIAFVKLFNAADPRLRGTWLITFALIAALLSVLLRRTLHKLAVSYRVQAAALLLVTVPVVFGGATISIAWAVLALALAAAGGLLDDRTARASSAIAWAAALVNLGMWTTTWHPHEAHAAWLHIFNHPLPAWTILAATIGLLGHAVALLGGWAKTPDHPRRTELDQFARLFSFLATGVFTVAIIAALPPFGATAALLGYAWLLVLLDRATPRLALGVQAWAVLILTTAKWASVDTLAMRMAPGWSAESYRPILNPLMLTAVALAGSLIGMFWLRRQSLERLLARTAGRSFNPAVVSVGIAIAVMTFGLTFEVDRTVEQLTVTNWPPLQLKLMGWTILWSIMSAAYVAALRLIDRELLVRPSVRNFARSVCTILTFKFLIFDTIGWYFINRSHPAPLINAQ
ncbi:MAG TPA: DUF2339 domain-containing protein, partial [Tepidisphaeraceae bacterium]